MKSPSIQSKSDTYGSIITNGHISSCSVSSVSDQTPLLHSQSQEASNSISTSDTDQLAIPPADHGKAAWLFLAGCFLAEGLIWGKNSLQNWPLITVLKVLLELEEDEQIVNANLVLRSTNARALAQAFHSPTVSSSNTTPPTHPSPPSRTISPPLALLQRLFYPPLRLALTVF